MEGERKRGRVRKRQTGKDTKTEIKKRYMKSDKRRAKWKKDITFVFF